MRDGVVDELVTLFVFLERKKERLGLIKIKIKGRTSVETSRLR